MRFTCDLTISGAIASSRAMVLLESPSAISLRILSSRERPHQLNSLMRRPRAPRPGAEGREAAHVGHEVAVFCRLFAAS